MLADMASQLCHSLSSTHSTALFSSPLRLQLVRYKSRSNACDIAPRMVRISAVDQSFISAAPPRRTGIYPPSLWDDNYIQSLQTDYLEEAHRSRFEKLMEETRKLIYEEKEIVDQLELVDALQQLGVAYHFEEEIKHVLSIVDSSMKEMNIMSSDDLYATAILFRLLRHHGFDVSQDIFNGFKDERGGFKDSYCHDTKSLLSFYEASYLGIEGEKTLDEARDFTTRRLKDCIQGQQEINRQPGLEEHVAYALEAPLHWRMQRLHARWFIDQYAKQDDMNPTLLELAKLDFNVVQSIHKRELRELSRWWVDLDIHRGETGFIRDRLVENYLWALGYTFEPRSWRAREAMAKANCLITAIDDVYDVYGTLDELELFTEAVIRWDTNAIDLLPEYMKTIFLALFNTTNGTAYKILKEERVDVTAYLKRAWTDLCKAFLIESRWHHKGHTPTLMEYLDNGWVSISGNIALTHFYCTMEDISKEALEGFKFYPDLVRHSSMLLRLYNDLATSKTEVARGDVQKSIQCYMYHEGVSEAVGQEHMSNLVTATWKDLNACCVHNSTFIESLKSVAVNIPRISRLMYIDGDKYGEPDGAKNYIFSLLIEPIPL